MVEADADEGMTARDHEEEHGMSSKKRLIAFLLCLFLGGLGIHRFYVGKIGTGFLTIATLCGGFGLWPLTDLINLIRGKFTDKSGSPLVSWT